MTEPLPPYGQRPHHLSVSGWVKRFLRSAVDNAIMKVIALAVVLGVGGGIVFLIDRFITHDTEELKEAREVAEEYRLALVAFDFEAACDLMVEEPFGSRDEASCPDRVAELVGPRGGPTYRAIKCRSAEDSQFRPRSRGSPYRAGDEWRIPIGSCYDKYNDGGPGDGEIAIREEDGEFRVAYFNVNPPEVAGSAS